MGVTQDEDWLKDLEYQGGFEPAKKRLSQIHKTWQSEEQIGLLKTGVKFLDDVFCGILPTDLVLIGAYTGVGKTELATSIAASNALEGKSVYYFALEAERGEIEQRILYRLFARRFFHEKFFQSNIGYDLFRVGRLKKEYERYRPMVEKEFVDLFGNTLNTFYRGRDFDMHHFKEIFSHMCGRADVIVIDHLQYFDKIEQKEEITEIMKTIRDMTQVSKIPIFLVSHLRRKIMGKHAPIMPSLDDFYGSSNIEKIATKAILLGRPPANSDNTPGSFRTLMQCAKNRLNGAKTRYVALTNFNVTQNKYEDSYKLGYLKNMSTEFEEIDEEKLPYWAK